MIQVFTYYAVIAVSFGNGIIGMMLLLTGDMLGILYIGGAIVLHFHSYRHKEAAMVILSIRRAGMIVRKCATEYTTDSEMESMFRKELLAEMINRNIENAEEKAKSLAEKVQK